MTSKPDLGLIVAIVSGVAVVAAIIAGLVTVGGPGEARDQRLDDAHYLAIGQIATAAQCLYAETGALPATVVEVRTQLANHSFGSRELECASLRADVESAVSYDVAAPDQINICAEFRRPSPPLDRQRLQAYADRFPELAEERAEIGRRCYLIQVRAL